MSNKDMTTGLVQTWVPTTDDDGRTRLEAQWVSAPVLAQATHAA